MSTSDDTPAAAPDNANTSPWRDYQPSALLREKPEGEQAILNRLEELEKSIWAVEFNSMIRAQNALRHKNVALPVYNVKTAERTHIPKSIRVDSILDVDEADKAVRGDHRKRDLVDYIEHKVGINLEEIKSKIPRRYDDKENDLRYAVDLVLGTSLEIKGANRDGRHQPQGDGESAGPP